MEKIPLREPLQPQELFRQRMWRIAWCCAATIAILIGIGLYGAVQNAGVAAIRMSDQ